MTTQDGMDYWKDDDENNIWYRNNDELHTNGGINNNISSIEVVNSLRIKLPKVAKDGAFITSRRYIYLISLLQSFSKSLNELIPFSMKANSITLSNFSASHLGRPVL